MRMVLHDAGGRRRTGAYIPLFWRIFIPNATVLAVAGIVRTRGAIRRAVRGVRPVDRTLASPATASP